MSPAGGVAYWNDEDCTWNSLLFTWEGDPVEPETSTGGEMTQVARPEEDILITGFEDEGGNSTDLYQSIDEVAPDDADFVVSSLAPTNDPVVFQLSPVDDPLSSINHVLRYRYQKSDVGGSPIDLTVELRQGYVSEGAKGTLVASYTHTDISDEVTQVSQTLSGTEADTITNYADLFLRFVFNQP